MSKEIEQLSPSLSSEIDNEFDYRLLTGHHRTDGSYKTDQELRMEYIRLTDGLIHKMTDGLEVFTPDTGEKEKRIPDTVIFLDKSARPLAWITKELWERLAPDPSSDDIPEIPDFKFLNIDRRQWLNAIDEEGEGYFDPSKVDPSVVRSLRSIFVDPQHKQDGLTEKIDTAPTQLDGKTIMVIDEVRSSGRTLDIAVQLIRKAFPDSYVGGDYWMEGMAMRGTATGNADLPVWYKDDDEKGRGVGDRQAEKKPSGKHGNLTQRLGSWFLSSRFPQVDQSALQLRREFHHLATKPDVPLRPSNDRDLDDIVSRLEAWNGKPAKEVMEDVRRITDQR